MVIPGPQGGQGPSTAGGGSGDCLSTAGQGPVGRGGRGWEVTSEMHRVWWCERVGHSRVWGGAYACALVQAQAHTLKHRHRAQAHRHTHTGATAL